MNRQVYKRTTKEGSSDLRSQNFPVPKNRSWPRVNRVTGQLQTSERPFLDGERNVAGVQDEEPGCENDYYEQPQLPVAEVWHPIKILPARPIKESEYADTRYFEDVRGVKGVADTACALGANIFTPEERHSHSSQMRLEEVDKPISKDIRSQHVKGDQPTKRNKTPVLPPRPPAVALSKKHQPLPPEPGSGGSPFPQRHTFPEVQRAPRQISLKNLSEVLGTEKVPQHQMKPESSQVSQNQSAPELPLAIASSPFMMSSKHSMQSRDPKESMQSHPPQPCQSPASSCLREDSFHCKNTSRRKAFPTRADEEDIRHNEWYIGESSRHVVEEALIKENKDGTFLVRDCSTKSRAEPYVLVVFYGGKVYNVKIRFLEWNQQFALGTGLRGEEKFDSVEDIIEHYRYFPIVLIDGKDKTGTHREQCYLIRPLPLNRLSSR